MNGSASHLLLSFLAAARQLQPIALVDEGDGQQQDSEHDEAHDAVSLIEL